MKGSSALPILFVFALMAAGMAPGQTCDIRGRAIAGGVPLPGVSVTASDTQTGKKIVTSTEVDGTYVLPVPSDGRYTVRAELSGFAHTDKEVVISHDDCHARAELTLTLLSRAQAAVRRPPRPAAPQGNGRPNGRGFQNLALAANGGSLGAEPQMSAETSNNADPNAALAAGINPDSATESVAISGATGQTNDFLFGGNNEDLRQRIEQMRERARQDGGGFGGPGRGGHGPGGPGGPDGRPMIMIGGRGRFNINRPHGALFYSAANGALDAKPYSLTGQPTVKPDYMQQRFGGAVGGPLKIPHIYDGGTKTFFFVTYFANRSENPYDVFSTVPTLAERAGDFSQTLVRSGPNAGQPVQIFNPYTHQPFANDQIPQSMINPAAQGLLAYIPEPNLPGDAQNFHYVTAASNNNDNLNLRLMHNFGSSGGPFMMGGPGMMGGGRGGGNGRPRNNINFGIHWQRSDLAQTNPLPSVQGASKAAAWDVPAGWVYGRGKLTNNLRFDFNRNRMTTTNLYAFTDNVLGQLGIAGVSQNPFDWGLPGLSFTNFAGLNDVTPMTRVNQTWTLSDSVIWNHGKHTVRFGGDFRRIHLDIRTDKNARGSFVFTGLYTSDGIPGAGLDFADFLLGLPQQASVQYGANSYHFAGNSWDLFVQDNWQIRGNLTLNIGLRYEYISPYTEQNNQIVNLDVAPGFAAVAPVLPGQAGSYTGAFPTTLIDPDRNNFAPRVGIAWKPMAKTVVRAGYGINYNTAQYAAMVQNLAFQPPFAFTETNIGSPVSPLLLQNAFPVLAPGITTNNYGVDRNYRLGYVQLWNLDIQRELTRSLLLNVSYNGSKGSHLDMLRAPNRGPDGLLLPNVQAFLWESSDGSSIMHSGTVRLRKRMSSGLSVGGSYTYSKSIDNASSIGGGTVVVAQNDLDLAAERGLSSFDQRHKLTADYVYELPFGQNKRWLAANGWGQRLFGAWQWSGDFTIASGFPFTARVLGNFADVARGTNGTLRADVTGQPIALPDPTVAEWFNTAAFTLPPPGQFGNAGRNTIIGPGTVTFNMALAKTIPFGDTKNLELRLQANNVFNTPQFTAIDTTVNSRTFGQVISVGAMRRLQMLARFRF